MSKIGLIVAMGKEFNQIKQLLANPQQTESNGFIFLQGNLGKNEIIALQCGIGKVCAALGAAELIRRFQPDYIINSGVAGALDSRLNVMDVVIGTDTVYHDVDCGSGCQPGQIQDFPLLYPGCLNLISRLKNIKVPRGIHFGLICSGDKFVSSAADLHQIKQYFPEALAVDMESCPIAQTCHIYRIPFVSLRIISDTPGITAHENQYNNFWDQAPETSFAVIRQLLESL